MQKQIPSSLDFEFFQNINFLMIYDQNIAKELLSFELKEKKELLGILLGLLSIYEIKQNLTHFQFVIYILN